MFVSSSHVISGIFILLLMPSLQLWSHHYLVIAIRIIIIFAYSPPSFYYYFPLKDDNGMMYISIIIKRYTWMHGES